LGGRRGQGRGSIRLVELSLSLLLLMVVVKGQVLLFLAVMTLVPQNGIASIV
jgi:hypothetical protein